MLRITREGAELNAAISHVVINDSLSDVADSCDIELKSADFDIFQRIEAGYIIDVQFDDSLVGTFEVTNVTLNDNNVIRMNTDSICATKSMKTPRSQTWRNVTLGSIIQEIGERHSLDVFLSPQYKTILVSYVTQIETSDLNFLADLAATYGAEIKLNADKLLFVDLEDQLIGEVQLGCVSSFKFTRNITECCRSVQSQYKKELVTVGDDSPLHIIEKPFYTKKEAKLAAENLLKAFRRKEYQVNIITELNTDIKSGCSVNFKNKEWIVFDVTHEIGRSFNKTELTAYLKQ